MKMGPAHIPIQGSERRFSSGRNNWRRNPQRLEWIERARTFGPGMQVSAAGAQGTVVSVDPATFTVRVRTGPRGIVLPYHVKTVVPL